ncbi:Neurotrypsin [Geodia barretti]|uniref:Neurotrypsin n=1 Tax=Geodia barretti TaxID=519541 RepID=A0AA35SN57_GEOBA|nr:Neurotrypsin [Geodia barretti]
MMGFIRVYCLVLFITLRASYTKGVRECVEGEVRLEDGEGDYVGRVGLCYRGQWGSVSQDHINEQVARVVCQQLELPSHDPKVVMQYAGAKGPVHLSRVVCSGNESSLLECHHQKENGRGPGSWFGRDIGVSCAPPCREGEVRLLRSRVQTCHNQVWGYICFSPDTWTHQSARVVCRELGLTSEEALADHEGFHKRFFPHFANLTNCTGSEGRLGDCPQSSNQERCGNHAAKAYCSGIERCPGNETVRLRELDRNMGSNVGRLEICYNGYWQSVCRHNATGPTSAIVACRELGYSNLLKATFTSIGLYDVTLPSIPILWEGLQCHGNERSLSDCPRRNGFHNCINWEDVVLHCRVKECNETDVRLVGGQSAAEGAVQICQNGLWVSVCDTRWDYRGAEIVCRQLGYHGSFYALREHVGSLQDSFIMNSTVVDCQ